MKIRTREDLVDRLDEDLAWRKKEIHYITSLAKSEKCNNREIQLRIGIAILYAHWEGFIKNASELYLVFVISQKHTFSELRNNFSAIKFYNLITDCIDSNSLNIHHDVIDKIFEAQKEKCFFRTDGVIKSGSNLGSSALKKILNTIGLDSTIYELDNHLIDVKLVKSRNEVVHGEKATFDIEDYEMLKDKVVCLLNDFKNRIENSVVMEEYKKQ